MATTNFKKLPTPGTAPHIKRRSIGAPATTHKSITRKLFCSNSNGLAKKKLEYSRQVKSSSKKKEFIGDLFGDNESMFGIPTIKTPTSRRRSSCSSTRASFDKSKTKVDSAPSTLKNTAPSQLGSMTNAKLGKIKSKIVTPSGSRVASIGGTAVFYDAESVMLEDFQTDIQASPKGSDIFHDASSISFEDQENESAVVLPTKLCDGEVYSTPQRAHDVYYGQGAISPLNSRMSPFSAALILHSPECGAFHDYYFGQGHYIETDNDDISLNDQPIHDVSFGQHMAAEQLLFTDLYASPEKCLTLYDSYFGQEDIAPNDFSRVDPGQAGATLQGPRCIKRGNSCFILFMILNMFHATMQPANTRYQRHPISTNDIFTQVSSNNSTAFNENIEHEHTAEGWFTRLF